MFPPIPPTWYRTRLARDVWTIVGVPLALCYTFTSLNRIHLGIWSAPVACASVVAWGYLRGLISARSHRKQAMAKGARKVPRVVGRWPGNVDVLLRMMRRFKTSYVLGVYQELFDEYQSSVLNLRILWKDQIITMDEEHSKFVLSTGFNNFWRGRGQKERLETFLGNGIFNRDDDTWRMHRSMARPFFARERISDFDMHEKYTTRTLVIMSSLSRSNQPCEVQDLFSRFSLDAASEFLFGENLDTLSGTLPVPGHSMGIKGSATSDAFGSFTQAFEEAQQIVTTRARLGHYFWPIAELMGDRSLRPQRAIRAWLDPLVRRAVEDKKRSLALGVTSPIGDKTFLQHLAESTDDYTLIRDELLSMLLAARDTTACLLTFTTYFMALHPDVATKMRAEVMERFGTDKAPTLESIRELRYIRAVMNETLRLFPPVPLNLRESKPAPCTLPPPAHAYPGDLGQPYYMPPNTVIMYFPLLTQRDQTLWGPDADVFDPDRWIDPDRLAKYTSNPMMYTPFSAGPRICLGQKYALDEAAFFLVRLLQKFDRVTLAPAAQPAGSMPPAEWRDRPGRQATERCWPAYAMTLFVKGGLWVQFHEASVR